MSYDFKQMKLLARKIEKIKDKNSLIVVRDIIVKNNPDIQTIISENSYGIDILFNKLTIQTYKELDEYLNELDQSDLYTENCSGTTEEYVNV